MGQSTDAILFFGFAWADEEVELFEAENEDEDEWVDIIHRRRGLRNPWDDYPEGLGDGLAYEGRRAKEEEWTAAHQAELDAMYAEKRAIREEFACDIGSHCSADYGMPYVYVKESELRAWRGTPVKVDSLEVGENWAEQIEAFLAELGIEPPEGQESPQWWLVSYWG